MLNSEDGFVFQNGNILIPTSTGLGLELNEENCVKYPYQHIELRHYNGTLTDVRPSNATSFYFNGLEGGV